MHNRLLGGLLAVAVSVVPAGRAFADAGDIVGGIVGGVVGGIIANEANRARQQPRTVTRKVYVQPKRTYRGNATVREDQTALNYFGFPAGSPDGVMGRNTRNAISQYQAHMGYPVTGELSPYQRSFLVSSYHRANAGGALTAQQIAASGQGTRGLLILYRNEQAGIPSGPAVQAAPSGTVMVTQPTVVAPAAAATAVTAAAATPAAPAPAPAPAPAAETAEAPAGALPSFGVAQQAVSMASHCNRVSLITNSNGGFTTPASATDAAFVGQEQFCLARTYAIAAGEELAESVQGLTMAEERGGDLYFSVTLSIKPRDQVIADVSQFALSSGQSPAQLASTARICLSSAYRTDNAELAIASGLLMVALGEPVYAELMGHHLAQGFGAANRPDLARGWYESAVEALEAGAPGAFSPGQSGERAALLRVAAGLGSAPSASGQPAQGATVLPAFNLPTAN